MNSALIIIKHINVKPHLTKFDFVVFSIKQQKKAMNQFMNNLKFNSSYMNKSHTLIINFMADI